MFVTSINIRRDGYYVYSAKKPDPNSRFRASIELHGQNGKIELDLSEELSQRIVDVIADEIVKAGRETAEALTAECIESTNTPARIA